MRFQFGNGLKVNERFESMQHVGQQFGSGFDDIGNRQSTTRDTRQASYSANNLNQHTSRDVPGFVNVLGTATNTATVSLWSQESTALFTPTTRKGDYFRGEMPFNNNTGAMWLTITNVAVLSNSASADIVTNIVGNLLLAKNPELFTYDLDGNLTSDSLWTNVWNGENRRITIESRSALPAAAKVKEDWTILADGRWVERIVSTNNGTSYYPSQTNRYVWDNQVLLAVLDHTNGVVVSFMRGVDLSGSIQGAGGVGGVLAVKVGPAVPSGPLANTTHFTCYDGNGNVAALMNAATGEESARYEYAPFAEKLRETGPMAKLNPIRFSTQYADDVTGDTKYLFRDYQADTGRWPSRDPIAERDLPNLYGFVGNNPISASDRLGLERSFLICPGCNKTFWVTDFQPIECPHCGWGKPKPPTPPDPVGFALCKREVNIEGPIEAVVFWYVKNFKLRPEDPTDHAYIHYKECSSCPTKGWGIGGTTPGAPSKEETKFNPSSCITCKRTEGTLQHGDSGKAGTKASDSEIIDCLLKAKTTKRYMPYGEERYNCLDWAKEAASACGLDCN